jgi:hypothetical protein
LIVPLTRRFFMDPRPVIQQMANIITAANVPGNLTTPPPDAAQQMALILLSAAGATPDNSPCPQPNGANLSPYTFPDDGQGHGGETAYLTADQVSVLNTAFGTRVRTRFLAQALINLIEDVDIAIAQNHLPAGDQNLINDAALLVRLATPTAAVINDGAIRYPGRKRPQIANLSLFLRYMDESVGAGYVSTAQIQVIKKCPGSGDGALMKKCFGSDDGELLGCCTVGTTKTANVPQACCTGSWKLGSC